MNVLSAIGLTCLKFHDEQVTNLPVSNVQCDECWSFVYCKDKNVPNRFKGKKGYGDIPTWIAMDPKTRLILTWHAGNRGTEDASIFMNQLAKKVSKRFQLTTDGHKPYVEAIEKFFGNSIDY